jgi:hypothetical protein
MATGIGYHVHISFTYPYNLEIKIIIFNAITGADFSVESGEEEEFERTTKVAANT